MGSPAAKIIGINIKRLRELSGLSQDGLASIVGGTYQQISKYERGENAPGGDKLSKIAEALGVSTDALVRESLEQYTGDPTRADQTATGGVVSVEGVNPVSQMILDELLGLSMTEKLEMLVLIRKEKEARKQ